MNSIDPESRKTNLLAVILCAAMLAFSSQAGAIPLFSTTYNLTPHDVGAAGGVEVTGGTFTTDNTIGTGLTLGSVLLDWSIDLKNGAATQTLTPSNSSVASDSAALFDITFTDISFVPTNNGGGSFFQIRDPSNTASYTWVNTAPSPLGGSLPSHLSIDYGSGSPSSEITAPAPAGVGNVATPEPASFGLLSLGVAGFGWCRRKSLESA